MKTADSKQMQGWKSATRRDMCGNCRHCVTNHEERGVGADLMRYRCGLGGFPTTRSAICNDHERGTPK